MSCAEGDEGKVYEGRLEFSREVIHLGDLPTLGIDRDSALLARLFNERDEGVKRLITSVIRVAHEHGRKLGLCGQAPSDDPKFAAWLAAQGIDSISVTSDALPQVLRVLAAPESENVQPAIASAPALVN